MNPCGACGHSDRHGRKGYGYCRHLEPTAETLAMVKKWERMYDLATTCRLAETLLALPGAAVPCKCKKHTPPKVVKP